jgi:hypothetical protein
MTMSRMSELDIERQERANGLAVPTEVFRLHNENGILKLVADGYGDLANRVYVGTSNSGISLNLNEASELYVQLGQLIQRLRPRPGQKQTRKFSVDIASSLLERNPELTEVEWQDLLSAIVTSRAMGAVGGVSRGATRTFVAMRRPDSTVYDVEEC